MEDLGVPLVVRVPQVGNPWASRVGYLYVQRSKQWMVTLYAPASNAFITSQTYQRWSDDIILRNSGRYCSVHKLQDKTQYGLIKTTDF